MSNLPLEGLLVVSLEQAVAAPFATRQLADLGARVIKIERDTGDFARGYDDSVRGMSSYFSWLNRGKESVVLDLKSESGLTALNALVAKADVFVQNLAPGAVGRLGLGPVAARQDNPKLIHVSISGYGTGGTYAQRKAYDLLIQCEAGLLSVTGAPDSPAKVGISIADICAGMYAYSGTLTSLLQRSNTGDGDVLEVSMLEALGEWVSQTYLFAQYGGAAPTRSGAQHASIAPYGPFDTADGTVFFGVQNEREWSKFCAVALGDPSIAIDQRFASNSLRVKHREDLHATIGERFQSQSSDVVIQLLDDANIANAKLRSMGEFSHHPQLEARKRWRDVASPVGMIRSLIPPVTSQACGFSMGEIPALGQHTHAVLAEFLPGDGN